MRSYLCKWVAHPIKVRNLSTLAADQSKSETLPPCLGLVKAPSFEHINVWDGMLCLACRAYNAVRACQNQWVWCGNVRCGMTRIAQHARVQHAN